MIKVGFDVLCKRGSHHGQEKIQCKLLYELRASYGSPFLMLGMHLHFQNPSHRKNPFDRSGSQLCMCVPLEYGRHAGAVASTW